MLVSSVTAQCPDAAVLFSCYKSYCRFNHIKTRKWCCSEQMTWTGVSLSPRKMFISCIVAGWSSGVFIPQYEGAVGRFKRVLWLSPVCFCCSLTRAPPTSGHMTQRRWREGRKVSSWSGDYQRSCSLGSRWGNGRTGNKPEKEHIRDKWQERWELADCVKEGKSAVTDRN